MRIYPLKLGGYLYRTISFLKSGVEFVDHKMYHVKKESNGQKQIFIFKVMKFMSAKRTRGVIATSIQVRIIRGYSDQQSCMHKLWQGCDGEGRDIWNEAGGACTKKGERG